MTTQAEVKNPVEAHHGEPVPTRPAFIAFSGDIQPPIYQPLVRLFDELIQQAHDEINVLLTTNGGDIQTGFAIHNFLRSQSVPVVTHNVGNVDSIGNVVFLGGRRRYAAPNARFMFHGVGRMIPANTNINAALAREIVESIRTDENRIADSIESLTQLTRNDINKFFKAMAIKDAAFALKAGIVDAIKTPTIPPGATVRTFPG